MCEELHRTLKITSRGFVTIPEYLQGLPKKNHEKTKWAIGCFFFKSKLYFPKHEVLRKFLTKCYMLYKNAYTSPLNVGTRICDFKDGVLTESAFNFMFYYEYSNDIFVFFSPFWVTQDQEIF
jgi:hypothetical protein